MSFLYMAALLVSITGLAVLDRKYNLAFALNAKRASITISIGVLFFLLWDVSGIALGIFFRGDAEHLTGLQLYPELPLEEIFFLILLCYSTLIIFTALERKLNKSGASK